MRKPTLPAVLLLAIGLAMAWTGAVLVDVELAAAAAAPRLQLPSMGAGGVLPQTNAAASPDAVRDALLESAGTRLAVAAGLALLVALLQLAVALWVRATARTHEMAVRRVLGPTTWQVVGPLLGESAGVLARGGGTALAVTLALAGLAHLTAPPGTTLAVGLSVETALAGTLLLTGCILLFGLLPAAVPPGRAIQALRVGAHATPRKSSGATVSLHVALAIALLYAGAVELLPAADSDGPDTAPAAGAESPVASVVGGLRLDDAGPETWARLRRALAGAGAGVASPGAVLGVGTRDGVLAECPGCVSAGLHTPLRPVDTLVVTVTPGWVRSVGISMVDGAGLDPDHDDGVLVNQAFVATGAVGSGSPVGRTIRLAAEPLRVRTIVGVVADVTAAASPSRVALPAVYVPWPPEGTPTAVEVVVPEAGAADVRTAVAGVPGVTLDDWVSVAAARVQARAPVRWLARWVALLGIVVFGVAAYGTFQATRAAVALRRREIGIRLALGASPRRVVRGVVWDTVRHVVRGVLLGTFLLLMLQPGAWNPGVFAAVAALVCGGAVAGGGLPAREAAAVHPAVTLRTD